ncbi:MAG: Na(+)-translocating NADH-quinone reductase subunit A [Flavobacteriaceae bacterium]|nr:Na(+)-translocating NADH-quinone reductase subunit A [Flavobacteriaceae bacterium]
MSKDIRIRKGVSLKLKGEASKVVKEAPRSGIHSIQPPDLLGIIPRLMVREGDTVKAGDPLYHAKTNENLKIASPVSGKITEVVRGQKRRILEIRIQADAKPIYKDFGKKDLSKIKAEEVKAHLLASGCWPFIKQRPYDVIANPEDTPRDIFISTYASAPLQADIEFILKDQQQAFQAGVDALATLVGKKVHLGVEKNSTSYLKDISNAIIHKVSGPYPAGNVGVLIHHIAPINAGERVWVVNPNDVAIIGNLFLHGKFDATKIVALAGSCVKNPQYYKLVQGAALETILRENLHQGDHRVINGTVFTGQKAATSGYLGFYNNTVSVIPEGNNYRMFGWMPFKDNQIPSIYNTSLFRLFGKKESVVNTNLNGEERAFVVTGEMESVFPFDVYPMQLLKACLANDIEKMENLGIYEVAPEDFAVIDYASSSKIEAQEIIREGLNLMIKEVG